MSGGLSQNRLSTRANRRIEDKEGKTFLFNVLDTPGQFRERQKEAIRESLKLPRVGIINVLAYGFHEGAAPKSAAVTAKNPRPDFLEANRQAEIRELAVWTEVLCGRGGPGAWLLTLVTKADLWWDTPDSHTPVLDHYRTGQYEQALGPARDLPHEVRPYSAANKLFYDTVKMSGYYSDTRRLADRDAVISFLLERASEL
jgi:hypothetical protein